MRREGARQFVVTNKLKQAVAQRLQPYAVQFGYMFGSAVTGRLHPESDVDIAVYFDPRLPHREMFRQTLALHGSLAGTLAVPEEAIDVTVLNNAPILLQHVVTSEGVVVHERNHDARVEFEMSVMRRRDDERHYRRLSRQVFLTRLAGETL